MTVAAPAQTPVLVGRPADAELTDHVLAPLWTRSRAWARLLVLASGGVALLMFAITYTLVTGIANPLAPLADGSTVDFGDEGE